MTDIFVLIFSPVARRILMIAESDFIYIALWPDPGSSPIKKRPRGAPGPLEQKSARRAATNMVTRETNGRPRDRLTHSLAKVWL